MSEQRLRVIVLSHGGCELAVKRLLELERVELAGIFVETDILRRRSLRERVVRSIRYDGLFGTISKPVRKVLGMGGVYDEGIRAISLSRDHLREIAEENRTPLHFVANYHSDESIKLLNSAGADLGVVLGTNILKESVFTIPRLGSINLHQGLAPYYRGGPSIFWELLNGEHEVGLTVHRVASKVDTGDIIVQRTVPLEYDDSYQLNYEAFINDYRQRLKVPCANLVAEAVRMIAEGTAAPWPQETSIGTRYRLPTKKEKDELRRRLRYRRRQRGYAVAQKVNGGDS
ncbi:MAG TPA: formyltransferase family protein [Blastocatellia bacterium]|nr:formyltransferase family protein [Blastocatellia bacterium]